MAQHSDIADQLASFLAAPTFASSLREPTKHNTVRLEVVRGVARIFINGQYVAQAALKNYKATPAMIFFYPDEAPLDVRFKRIRLWHVRQP